jgi:hypothetical protein
MDIFVVKIIDNYENLFYFFVAPISNNIFWIVYLCLFNNHSYNHIIHFLIDYIQPSIMIIQILLTILYGLVVLNSNNEITKGELLPWKKLIVFILGFVVFTSFAVINQGVNIIIAWFYTLKKSHAHSESALKIVFDSKKL